MHFEPLNWHSTPAEKVFTHLHTSTKGLASKSISGRLETFGHNKLPTTKKRGIFIRLINQFHNILIYLLLISGAIALFLQHWTDASVIFGVVIINAIIGCIQEGKAEAALDAIKNMLSLSAEVIRDNKRYTIPAFELVPGDIVLLQAGSKVPADLRLFETKDLQIQEAILTGESNPIDKTVDIVASDSTIGDRFGMAYSGTIVTYGTGKGIVIATGLNTEIGRISSLVSEVKPFATPLLRQMQTFGYWLSAVIVIMAFISFFVGIAIWHEPIELVFMAAVSIAVAAIPEGLPPILTIDLAIGVTRMAKRNAIIRRLPAVETIGSVSVICTDKTGTLTHNELMVQDIITAKSSFHVTGSGYSITGNILENDTPIIISENVDLLQLINAGILCNDAHIHTDHQVNLSGNPTDGSILVVAHKANIDIAKIKTKFPREDSIPFSTHYKFMATLNYDQAKNNYIFLKGAPEKILDMCTWQRENTESKNIDREYWENQISNLATTGKRVVAMAMQQNQAKFELEKLDNNFIFLGLFGIIDPPRKEAIKAVAECQNAGIRIKMITGDHAETARAIAAQVGIHDGHGVLIGNDLDNLCDEELIKTVQDINIFARTTPEHKVRLVKALQANNAIVAMTGDGVNDTPALKQAAVGIAMGKKGTDAAKEVADIVLADDNFVSIWNAIKEGRTVYDNIKKAILFILPTNAAEAFSVMIAMLFGKLLPITAVQILWVNMLTAVTLGLALSFEPPETSVSHRKPRDPREPILSPFLVWRITFVTTILVGCVFGVFLFERNSGISLAAARTVVINMLVAGEIVYLINCRKIYENIRSWQTAFGGKAVPITILSVILLQLLFTYAPIMQRFFGTAAIGFMEWLIIAGLAIVIFILVETEKFVIHRFK